jgi:starch synthase
MEKKRILYVSQEIFPYLPESEMSEISRYLPQGIQERGREIRTFMPRYGCVNERRNQLHEVIRLSGMNLVINDTDHPLIIKVASIQAARMQVYFIDNEDYFQRKCVLTDPEGNEFPDNDERAVFFAHGVLETVIKLRWAPDIIHCHGWLTSLIPLYIKKYYYHNPLFKQSKLIYSAYNDDFVNTLSPKFCEKLLLDGIEKEDVKVIHDPTYVNVNKLAINFSDGIIKATESINAEVESYIKSSGKLNLGYQPRETYIDAYNEFYNQIF